MKYIIKSIAIVLMVLHTIPVQAQNSPINFTLNSASLELAGEELEITSIIHKTGKFIAWQQNKNGKIDLTRLTVIGTSGHWNKDTSLGSITYATVDPEGSESELTLTGTESSISVTLSFKVSETESNVYNLNIDTITYE